MDKPRTPLILPRPTPPPRLRQPIPKIPQTRAERDRLALLVRAFVKEWAPVPPLTADDLRRLAAKVLELNGLPAIHREYAAILINNELWRETVAAIPFERRLLLLPKCLRESGKCPATFDAFGLLCEKCGLCSIHDLQAEAEHLGYAVLVAEGSALVVQLIQAGRIDAIVGVSCIPVLERAFPHMEAAAIPGIAIPLLQDDCTNTTADLDWVREAIHLTSADRTRRLDLSALRCEIADWFSPAALDAVMGPAEGDAEAIARAWLARAGKRWRPFLAVATFQALRDDPEAPLTDDIRRIALSVECFHKASLIHDDIEDGDATRYGAMTLHEEHGLPVALNVGDLLVGEGYRMIRETRLDPARLFDMLHAAVDGHRRLCRGQGEELAWARNPTPLSQAQVLDIFRQKTAPAFDVALRLGAICAGRLEPHEAVIAAYSEALGIAYQIRDDLADFAGGSERSDVEALRPSLLLAAAYERAPEAQKQILDAAWRRRATPGVAAIVAELKAGERGRALLERYREQAIRSLGDLDNANLKGLLRRVIGRIFDEAEFKGWCNEFESRNAARRAAGSPSSG